MRPTSHTGETLGSAELKMIARVTATARHMSATRNIFNFAIPPGTISTKFPPPYSFLNRRYRGCLESRFITCLGWEFRSKSEQVDSCYCRLARWNHDARRLDVTFEVLNPRGEGHA